MVPRRGFVCMFMLIAVLSSWAAVASGQKPAFVIGEKLSGSVGFYSADGKRLSGAKQGSHPHESVLSPDKRTLYVADNGVLWMTEASMGENTVSIVDIPSRKTVGIMAKSYRRILFGSTGEQGWGSEMASSATACTTSFYS
jgi:hypothetical protein